MNSNILKIVFLVLLSISFMKASNQSFSFDNDAFIGGKDAHYTNGFFYTWMGESEDALGTNLLGDLKTNNAISFSHLIFTPEDKKESNLVLDDLPYAGYAKLNFLLYKSSKNYFHEFGMNLGLVGPSVKAEKIQTSFHKIIGANKSNGWDNQLKDEVMTGLSYNFAKKNEIIKFDSFEFDWINNIRGDLGNFYTGVLGSTTFRIGKKIPDTFVTSGNFIGGNESDILNYKPENEFNWNLSLSLFANKIYNYYIVDEAIDLGYEIEEMNYILGQQLALDIFHNEIQYRFKVKSIIIYDDNNSSVSKNWGGISVIWKF